MMKQRRRKKKKRRRMDATTTPPQGDDLPSSIIDAIDYFLISNQADPSRTYYEYLLLLVIST